jgi:hypothetical protein
MPQTVYSCSVWLTATCVDGEPGGADGSYLHEGWVSIWVGDGAPWGLLGGGVAEAALGAVRLHAAVAALQGALALGFVALPRGCVRGAAAEALAPALRPGQRAKRLSVGALGCSDAGWRMYCRGVESWDAH